MLKDILDLHASYTSTNLLQKCRGNGSGRTIKDFLFQIDDRAWIQSYLLKCLSIVLAYTNYQTTAIGIIL